MKVCITGGAGYVGSMLVPRLLEGGHEVVVLDTFWFGDNLPTHDSLRKIKGDIRRKTDRRKAFEGTDAVIHLACVSNDPSFDMNPKLGRTINYDCFKDMLSDLKREQVERFIYASSSSVYGVSDLERVTEMAPKKPLTDYSKFKLACEAELKTYGTGGKWTIIRPATVCGYSPRQRLDLVVNIMTAQAIANRRMTVHGGSQTRPNINILDMCRAYETILTRNDVHEKTYNVGFENMSLLEIAGLVARRVGGDITIEPVKDERSYRVDSERIYSDIGFKPIYDISQAIGSIYDAVQKGSLSKLMTNNNYYNIKRMKDLKI